MLAWHLFGVFWYNPVGYWSAEVTGDAEVYPSTENTNHPFTPTHTVYSASNQPNGHVFEGGNQSNLRKVTQDPETFCTPPPLHDHIFIRVDFRNLLHVSLRLSVLCWIKMWDLRPGRNYIWRERQIGNGRDMSRCVFSEHWTHACAAAAPILRDCGEQPRVD